MPKVLRIRSLYIFAISSEKHWGGGGGGGGEFFFLPANEIKIFRKALGGEGGEE